MTIRGGCCCGVVRYQVDGSLRNARCCPCAECRKAFSGASSAYAEVDAASFAWTRGERNVTHYSSLQGGAWGSVERVARRSVDSIMERCMA